LFPGATLGSLVGGYISDAYGRKLSIVLADINFIIGSAIMGMAVK